MKILLISNKVPYPARDGSSIAVKSIIDGLLYNKAELTLLSINTLKHFKSTEEIKSEKPAGLNFKPVKVNTNITLPGAIFNIISGKAYHLSRFYSSAFRDELSDILQKQDFDVIQIEGLAMGLYLNDIRKLSRAKVYYRAHNVEFRIWERQVKYEKNPLKKLYLKEQIRRLRKFEIEFINKVDGLIAITQEDLNQFKTLGLKKPGISIACGIDIEEISPSENQVYEADIAYLASYDWQPNLKGLLWFLNEVWPLVQKKCGSIKMKIGGRHLPASISGNNYPGIKFHDKVESSEEFINSAKILIVPLLAGSGMRIKIVENLALGKAMVSTTIGAEGIVVKDGENMLLADNPENFAEKICLLLKEEDLRLKIERQARLTAENFYNNIALGKQLLQFYQNT